MRIFKTLITCCLLLMCLNTIKAQDYQKIDSLKRLIYNTSSDSVRVIEVLELSKLYSFTSPDSSLLCINAALKISKEMNSKFLVAKSYTTLGIYHYNKRDLVKALFHWELALDIYKGINSHDEAMANVLSNIGVVHMLNADYEKATLYYNECLAISTKYGLQKQVSNVYGNIAIVMVNIGNPDSSMACHKKSLEIDVELNNTDGILTSMINLGAGYKRSGDFQEALKYYHNALKLAQVVDHLKMESTLLYRIGSLYQLQGEYVKALSFFQEGLLLNDGIKSKADMAISLSGIGLVHYKLMDYETALDYFEKSLELNEELDYQRGIAWNLGDIGLVYQKMELPGRALEFQLRALEINQRDGNSTLEAVNLSNIGILYVDMGDFTKAEEYYEQSLEIDLARGDKQHLTLIYANFATMYNYKGDYSKAIPYGEKAIAICDEIGTNDVKKEVYEYLSESYNELGDYENAYKYRSLWIALKDSVFNTDKTKAIAEIETKYQTEKKEKQILALNLEKETISKEKLQEEQKTRTTIFVTSGILGLIIVLFIIVRLRSKNREVRLQSDFRNLLLEQSNRLNEGKQIERDRIAAELHDGIGSQVNGVYMHLDRLTESEQSDQYKYVLELQKIGTRIRNLSHQLNDTQSANKQHLSQLIEDLCTLHQANNFKVDFQSNNAIENLEFSQLAVIQIYTIIQESLNNTMKHAKATKVTIDMISENDQLSLSIADNGKGMGENQSDGFGLKSIKKRIKSLRGKLEILGADGVFLKIQFPLKTVVEA